jgi:transglutaminase-like putative cysteine protease
MHITVFTLFYLLVFAGISAKAQAEQVRVEKAPAWVDNSALASVPKDASGLLYLRRSDYFVHLHKDGQFIHQNQRMKLLDARALEAGNLALTWNPDSGVPTVHTLRIHRGATEIDVLASNTFEVIQREDQLEQSMLTGYLTAILTVPDLRVGDELEFAYTVPSHDPVLGPDSSGLIAIAPSPFPGHYKLSLSWDKGQKPNIKLAEDLTRLQKSTANAVSVTLKDPEVATPPKDAPPRYNWQRVIEYSDYTSWPVLSQRFHGLYLDASQLAEGSDVKGEAKQIARAHSGDFARMSAALALVQQQVRYVYAGMNGGNIKPASADETWRRRYGDCKGKTALLLALLRELGIPAEVIFVNSSGADDGFDERLPNLALFDHVLLRVELNGAKYWLDATLPSVIEPSLSPFLPFRWVLPLSADGKSLEPVKQDPFALPQEMYLNEIDMRQGFDQSARLVQTSITRGVEGLAEYMQYSSVSAAQLKAEVRRALAGTSEWDEIEDVSLRYDRGTQASIFTVIGTGPVDWDKDADGSYSLALPRGGFRPPARRQRPGGGGKDVPFYTARDYSCSATTVRLPEDTDVENWDFNSVYETNIYGRTYYRMMERRDDGTIRMVRGSRVEEPEITPKQALQDNQRLENFNNSKAVIQYTPDQVAPQWGFVRDVPATYEIDWVNQTTHCLPSTAPQSD